MKRFTALFTLMLGIGILLSMSTVGQAQTDLTTPLPTVTEVPTGAPGSSVTRSSWGQLKVIYRGDRDGITNGSGETMVKMQKPVAAPNAFPNYSFALAVPYVCQFTSSDVDVTKNCGEACAVMIGGYFNHGPVSYAEIRAEDKWLATRFKDPRYNNRGGWYTNFNGRNELGTLLREYHGLQYALGCATTEGLVELVRRGYPVIVGVRISGGRLIPGANGTYNHWAVVIGWSNGLVINDPGTSHGTQIYSVSAFQASWASSGNMYAAVWK